MAALAFFAISCSSSSSKIDEAILSEFNEIIERNKAVGLVVAAVKDGEIVYTNSFGYKDLEKQIPIEEDDKLRIASISKSFVATSILQLVEQGKLSLDADISDLMGFEIRNPNFPDTPITVRMLLSHTSSMSDANGYFSFDYMNPAVSPTWQKAWNEYAPGTKYQYCNLGFNTLGAIIEIVSGERFDNYVKNHIFKPLGIDASHNVMDLDTNKLIKIYTYRAKDSSFVWTKSAYESPEQTLENYKMGYSTTVFSPTGGVKISGKDLAKVMMMHMNKGTLNGVKIIDSTSSALMQSEITTTNLQGENYGMAIIHTDDLYTEGRAIGHDGLALGAYTAMYWLKDSDFGVVVLTNGCSGVADGPFVNILCESADLLEKYFNE